MQALHCPKVEQMWPGEYGMYFGFRAKQAPNLVNSQPTTEASTVSIEGNTLTPEQQAKATRRCEFY